VIPSVQYTVAEHRVRGISVELSDHKTVSDRLTVIPSVQYTVAEHRVRGISVELSDHKSVLDR
jgi:hypothetical protein